MKLFVANFNAESFWRDEHLATLPGFTDDQADAVVGVMDELQFVFSEGSDDTIVTRLPMNPQHKEYLHDLGICFSNDAKLTHGQDEINTEFFRKNIFELIYHSSPGEADKKSKDLISPFAVIPYADKLQVTRNFTNQLPDLNVVRKVNSKEFSHNLTEQIFGTARGRIARNAGELEEIGSMYLEHGAFLVKDVFGVSGKGNLKVESQPVLQRIARHLRKQEPMKQVCLLIEPYLDKAFDFSCQFNIDSSGNTTIVSTHKFKNIGFAFSGSEQADDEFRNYLNDHGYYDNIIKVGESLYAEGYFGEVCIDSMQLTDGSIVPLVEINARKSMSLINHYMDKYLLSNFGRSGLMVSFSLNIPGHLRFTDLIHQLKQQNILFSVQSPRGVIPLSANTFDVNGRYGQSAAGNARFRGKFYASIVSQEQDNRDAILRSLHMSFASLDITVI